MLETREPKDRPAPWWIDEGIADAQLFFELVPEVFPNATTLCVEGGAITKKVADCYRRYVEPGPYLRGRQTVWPRGRLFRCQASSTLFAELASLAAQHANPELLDHLALYEGDLLLVDWHDAFANGLLIRADAPERAVAQLAAAFGCDYERSGLSSI